MENDDRQQGRILSRREMLTLLEASGVFLLAGCDVGGKISGSLPSMTASEASISTMPPACVVVPESTAGPYFVDEQINRTDIRSDPTDSSIKEGLPLVLAFNISQMTGKACAPLANAKVDVWHCDAQGIYSGVSDPGFNTVGKKFLRGYQMTDASGTAKFTTIVPGWYKGRAVHVHFKIRTTTSSNQSYEFTSQLYFDDAVIDHIYASAPYAAKGNRDKRNAADNLFKNGGDQLVLTLSKAGQGYAATFPIGLDLSDAKVGAPDTFRQPGRPPQ